MMERAIAKLNENARNELHSIMGMLELVAEGPLTESQYKNLLIIRSSADRLLRSIEDVTQFVSPSTQQPRLSAFDLPSVVADTSALMGDLARLKGLTFTFEIRSGTPTRVMSDRECIEDILVRLMDNSLRFTEKGGFDLTVSQGTNASVRPRLNFIICDTGPGIPGDTIARVMNPAAPDHLKDGLGLPLVHKLVLRMGGDLHIDRSDGGGTRITVSVPFEMPEASDSPEVPYSEAQSYGQIRPLEILIAEDSDESYYVIESYLDGEGHQLTRAQNGVSALDWFKKGDFDVVLMDIHMPVMDGYSATRAIREWETTNGRPRVPIVVLSSDSLETQRENGAKAGCSGYITKPASKAAVLNSIRRFAATRS